MTERSLVGMWRLVSCESRDVSGNVSYPIGQNASGYLTYTPDGYMWATIVSPNRVAFASQDRRKATPEEKVAAFDTYVSYCGTYERRGIQLSTMFGPASFRTGSGETRSVSWNGLATTSS
jgi:lipocalin-like protein